MVNKVKNDDCNKEQIVYIDNRYGLLSVLGLDFTNNCFTQRPHVG